MEIFCIIFVYGRTQNASIVTKTGKNSFINGVTAKAKIALLSEKSSKLYYIRI